jgi:hypothetical protein
LRRERRSEEGSSGCEKQTITQLEKKGTVKEERNEKDMCKTNQATRHVVSVLAVVAVCFLCLSLLIILLKNWWL